VKRRAILVLGLTLAAAGVAGQATASELPSLQTTRSDTNGCVVIDTFKLAICIPRF
jgi:hypothetical protein